MEPDKVVRWCADGEFLAIFASLFSASRVQHISDMHSILNLRYGHIKCQSMVDIQSEIRRGKKKKLECGPMPNVMAALSNIGGALCSTPQSLADAHYQSAVHYNAV